MTGLHRDRSLNETITVDQGERVYPCRCGKTHRGPYASVDYRHHACFHDAPLTSLSPEDPGHFICSACGKSFFTEPRYSADSGMLLYREGPTEDALRWLSDKARVVARKFAYAEGEYGIRWWLEELSDRLVWVAICRASKRYERKAARG